MNLATLQAAALQATQALEAEQVLTTLVEGLAAEPIVALARIWLVGPGDLCDDCALRAECPSQERCLHLVASAGASRVDASERWTTTDGRFRRFPIGVRKVGRIAESGEPLYLCSIRDQGWLAHPEWGEREDIRCFSGAPLVFRGEVLGVLALFGRGPLDEDQKAWLKTYADHAAVALANARAFEEVHDLRHQLELERDYLREEVRVAHSFGRMVGESPAIRQVMEQVEVVAPSEATVLIEGESGTGKELVAVALHERSARADGPLVRVNCASIPHELFESEFFGHVTGAFTGATRDRAGRFQVADGGTLFLDEVGEIPLELQGKLLRALQEGQFSRIGEDHERAVDVRVVAATNRDLFAEVRAGRFREDLYYRLSVFPLRVPPLRERRQDVAPLAQHFVETLWTGPPSKRPKLRRADLDALLAYDWPGNVRELQNAIERALIAARAGRLALQLPGSTPTSRTPTDSTSDDDGPRLLTAAELRALERDNLVAVLDRFRWKIAGRDGAAEFLGLHPATLSSRLRAMKIERPRTTGA